MNLLTDFMEYPTHARPMVPRPFFPPLKKKLLIFILFRTAAGHKIKIIVIFTKINHYNVTSVHVCSILYNSNSSVICTRALVLPADILVASFFLEVREHKTGRKHRTHFIISVYAFNHRIIWNHILPKWPGL